MGDIYDLEAQADKENLLQELIQERENEKSVNLQDKTVAGQLFQTVFFKHNGKYRPFVITDRKEVIPVVSRFEELIKEGIKPKKISDEEKYHYFEHEGYKYRFIIEDLGWNTTYGINHPSKAVLHMVQKKTSLEKSLFEEIKGQIKDYWDFDKEEEYDIQAADCVESYISRAIGGTIYTIFNGVEDTGKSTIQRVKSKLQFNAKFAGRNTVAVSARQQHLYGIVINQDEFEKMSAEARRIFIGCANTGFYPDGTYEYVDTNKKTIAKQITVLRTFGKRSFSSNNLAGFDKSFLSRCHEIVCTRQDRKLKSSVNLSEEEVLKFQDLTDKQFLYTLENWRAICEDIKEMKNKLEEDGLFGRQTDKNSILLGIIKHFKGVERKEEVKIYLQNLRGIEEKTVSNNTTDALIMEFLVNKFTEVDSSIVVENREIVDFIAEQRQLDDRQKASLSRSIGHTVKKLKLIQRQTQVRKSNRGAKYELERGDLANSLKRFKFQDLEKKLNSVLPSQTSQTSLTSQKSDESDESDESERRTPIDIFSYFDYQNPKTLLQVCALSGCSKEELQPLLDKALQRGDIMQYGWHAGEQAPTFLLIDRQDVI